MKYIYDLAGVKILIDLPFKLTVTEESVPFIKEVSKENELSYKMKFNFIPMQKISFVEAGGEWVENRYYIEEENLNHIYFSSVKGEKPYAHRILDKRNKKEIDVYFDENKVENILYSHNILDIMGIENILNENKGFLLHSSFIRYKDEGVLFSAPSGTGKSTQADLWVEHFGAEILNGDKAGIRKKKDGFRVFGLPYAGTSGIYKKENTGLKSIVILRQAKENRIERLSPVKALSAIYGETTVHRWDRDFADSSLNILSQLVTEIPVYLLSCLPNREAAELTRRKIYSI